MLGQVPNQQAASRRFAVGDRVRVNIDDRIVHATVREVRQGANGLQLTVDLGLNKKASVESWQVAKF
jgi:hypothetical protein